MLTAELKENKITGSRDGDKRSLGSKVVRSVAFGALRYIVITPIPFFMTPLILHKIGPTGYGTWAVFLAMNGLTSLTDLGLVGTLSKFVAEYHAQGDYTALSKLLGSGLSLFICIDLIVGAALWSISPVLAERAFRGSAVPVRELVVLMHLFLIVIAANVLSQLFASITTGLQRLDLTNIISAGNTLFSAVLAACLLLQGWGLRGLVYGYIGSATVTIGSYLVLVRRLLPQVTFSPKQFDTAETRKMFGYSLRLYVTQAAVVVHNQVEKVLLSTLTGVIAAGWYDIASDVALKVRGSLGFILGPILPAASELDALGDSDRLKELYYRAHKYLAACGVPVVCFVMAVSHRFVELWLGPKLTVVALPLSALLVVNFINLGTGPGFLILAGKGDMRPGIESAVLGLVLNVILSFVLIYKFGFAGAVIGTCTALALASGYFILLFHRRSAYPYARVISESYLKPTLCSMMSLVPVMAILHVTSSSWVRLAEVTLVFGVFYSVTVLLSRFFDEYDWRNIERLVPVAKFARKLA